MNSIRDDIMTFDFRESNSLISSVLLSDIDTEYFDGYYADDDLEHLSKFRLPVFQRPAVWSMEQNIRLIENIWRGIPIGSYSVNVGEFGGANDMLLLDGQQRIRAIILYVNDGFRVFGKLYSELSQKDYRFFSTAKFSKHETRFSNEQDMRDYYNAMNFGGVNHTESQRA